MPLVDQLLTMLLFTSEYHNITLYNLIKQNNLSITNYVFYLSFQSELQKKLNKLIQSNCQLCVSILRTHGEGIGVQLKLNYQRCC